MFVIVMAGQFLESNRYCRAEYFIIVSSEYKV